jgi:hypothetical protein
VARCERQDSHCISVRQPLHERIASGIESIERPDSTRSGKFRETVSLELSANKSSGHVLPERGQITRLAGLNLSSYILFGKIPRGLGALAGLESLDLRANQLTGHWPEEQDNLDRLQDLSLQGKPLNGSIPAQIGNLTQLVGLELFENQLSGKIPAEPDQLANLDQLWLENNSLSGEVPPEHGSLRAGVTCLGFN